MAINKITNDSVVRQAVDRVLEAWKPKDIGAIDDFRKKVDHFIGEVCLLLPLKFVSWIKDRAVKWENFNSPPSPLAGPADTVDSLLKAAKKGVATTDEIEALDSIDTASKWTP